jgi:hypothetical protein
LFAINYFPYSILICFNKLILIVSGDSRFTQTVNKNKIPKDFVTDDSGFQLFRTISFVNRKTRSERLAERTFRAVAKVTEKKPVEKPAI